MAQKKNVEATFVVGQKQNNNQPKEWQFNYVAISICEQFMQSVACEICQSTRAAYTPISDYLEVFLHKFLPIVRYIDMLFHLHLYTLIKKSVAVYNNFISILYTYIRYHVILNKNKILSH